MAKKTISTSYTSWKGTSKKDTVYIDYVDYVNVSTGKGNDSIYNDMGYYVTINGGSGNDTIMSYGGNGSSINAGEGDDKISLRGGYSYTVTLTGGKGKDTIYGSGNKTLHKYKSGDGNDVIFNWSANDTLSISGGSYSKKTSGNNVILTVGSGKITLKGAKGKTINIKGTLAGSKDKTINNTKNKKKLNGTSSADTITNSGEYVTISGGKGNDKITNSGICTSINGGDGNDSIINTNNAVTITGGAGKDYIYNDGTGGVINGGSGNDTIKLIYSIDNSINGGDGDDKISLYSGNWGNNIKGGTVAGGKGSDTIYGDGTKHVYKYANGDGADTIYNIGSTDTISIGGAKYTRSTVGSDVVLKVGKGLITLKDAAGTTLNIKGTLQGGSTSNRNVRNYTSYETINGTSSADSIQNYGSNVKIYGNAGNDSIVNIAKYSTLDGGAGKDMVINMADSVTIDSGSGRDEIYNIGNYSKVGGGSDGDYISNGHNEDTIAIGDFSFSIDGGVGNYSTVSSGAGNDTILNFADRASINGDEDNDIITNGYFYDDRGKYSTLNGGYGNDTIASITDNTTINGGKGNDEISLYDSGYYSYYNVVQYKYGDGNDTIWGYNSTDTLKITGGSYTRSTVGNDVVIKVGSGSITFVDARYKTININTSNTYYNVADDWISADDNNFATSANLSSIVDSGAANYSVAELDSDLTSLIKKNNLIAYSGKK